MQFLLIYLIAINIITFITYGIDKHKAKTNQWRIPERTLIALAIIGGSIGAILGMYTFHHKTRHNLFRIGIPVIIAFQMIAIRYTLRMIWG